MARLNRTIDFNAENPCPVYNMGHVGEHCSTVLTIIAPESLSIANGAEYICAAVETGGKIVRSQLTTSRTIVLPLTRDYTQSEYFNLQVEGYSTDEGADGTNNFVGKSKMIKGLRLAPSVEGENVLEGAEPQTVTEAVAAMMPVVPIEKIATADNTEITPVEKKVTLPNFALASALANYYLKTDTMSAAEINAAIAAAAAEKISLPSSPNSGEALVYDGTNDIWKADIPSAAIDITTKTGLEMKLLKDAGKVMKYASSLVISSGEARLNGVDGYRFRTFAPLATGDNYIRNYWKPNDNITTTQLYDYYVLSSSEYAKLSSGAISDGNSSFITGGQAYTALAEKISLPSSPNGGDALIYDSTNSIWKADTPGAINITGKTGSEIKTLWNAGKALMDNNKKRIISLNSNYTHNNKTGILYDVIMEYSPVASNTSELAVYRCFQANDSTSSAAIQLRYTLSSDAFGKLYNGAVANNNSSFVTGGQVYDALEEADITVIATSTKSIASSITGSNSVTWSTLTANKTLEQLLARVTAHKPIRVGGYLASTLSLEGTSDEPFAGEVYQPWEVIYAGKVEGGWLADETGADLSDADTESYGVVVRVSNRYNSSGTLKHSIIASKDIIIYKDTNGDTQITYDTLTLV